MNRSGGFSVDQTLKTSGEQGKDYSHLLIVTKYSFIEETGKYLPE